MAPGSAEGHRLPRDRIRERARTEPHRIGRRKARVGRSVRHRRPGGGLGHVERVEADADHLGRAHRRRDRKSTRLNSSHSQISYAVFCLKKKKTMTPVTKSYGRKWDQNASGY